MTETTAHRPQPGEQAPDFTLASTAGQDISLASFRGSKHVLLAFFPLAFTGTCTKEVCAFSEDFDVFAGKSVEVIPVSVDAVPSLKQFKKSLSLKGELYSDFKRVASRAYGVLRPDTFYSNRAYFLIDRNGTVRWTHVEDVPGQWRQNAEILDEIAKLEA